MCVCYKTFTKVIKYSVLDLPVEGKVSLSHPRLSLAGEHSPSESQNPNPMQDSPHSFSSQGSINIDGSIA